VFVAAMLGAAGGWGSAWAVDKVGEGLGMRTAGPNASLPWLGLPIVIIALAVGGVAFEVHSTASSAGMIVAGTFAALSLHVLTAWGRI